MFNDLYKVLAPLANEAAATLVIIAFAVLVSSILKRLIKRRRDENHLQPIMAGRLQTFRRWAILLVTVLILMEVLGIFGSAWGLISAGLAALAIGFVAAWSMLSNATAALLVLTFRPFRLGDTVELVEPNGSAIGGCVVDMNLMFTILSVQKTEAEQAEAPQLLCIPNNLFFQKVLRTRPSSARGIDASFFPQRNL